MEKAFLAKNVSFSLFLMGRLGGFSRLNYLLNSICEILALAKK
jgi:hypothetical protein